LTHPRRKQTSCRQRNRMTGDPPPTVPMRSRPTHAEGLGVQRSVDFDRTYQLLCGCSYKVRCDVMRHGERLCELTFFDDEEASESGTALGAAADSVFFLYDLEAGPRHNPDVVSREGYSSASAFHRRPGTCRVEWAYRFIEEVAPQGKLRPAVLDRGVSDGLGKILEAGS
jgi:hypothetical protein